MASIADMERQDRLQGLWDYLVNQLPNTAQRPSGGQIDPLSLISQSSYGQQIDPYLKLRLLQVGQALGPMMNQPTDQDMIGQLIQQLMQQQPQR